MYREENGQVILTMSREDYDVVLIALGSYTANFLVRSGELREVLQLVNRLNQGNPNFRPYQVEK